MFLLLQEFPEQFYIQFNMQFKIVKWQECAEKCASLWEEHWQEVGIDCENSLNVNFEQYEALCKAGMLQIVIATEKEKVIGYIWHIIMPSMHQKNKLCSFLDVWFVKKSKRRGGVAIKMFKFAEKNILARGINRMYVGHTVKLPLGRVFKALGYELTELTYSKMV